MLFTIKILMWWFYWINKLSEIDRINFNSIYEFINSSHVAIAANTNLWVFNLNSQQLELYDYRSQSKRILSQPINGEGHRTSLAILIIVF